MLSKRVKSRIRRNAAMRQLRYGISFMRRNFHKPVIVDPTKRSGTVMSYRAIFLADNAIMAIVPMRGDPKSIVRGIFLRNQSGPTTEFIIRCRQKTLHFIGLPPFIEAGKVLDDYYPPIDLVARYQRDLERVRGKLTL